MRTKKFLRELEHDRITGGIKEAEAKTSGEIRVFIQRGLLEGDPVVSAQQKFHELGMQKTKERNAVLIFVAPRAQKFAVVGDQGIHQKCGEKFWQALVERMRRHFQNENFTEALVEAIEATGILLAKYFPRIGPDTNELPDHVIES